MSTRKKDTSAVIQALDALKYVHVSVKKTMETHLL